MPAPKSVLIIEDSTEIRILLKNLLQSEYEVSLAETIADARAQVTSRRFDLVLLDQSLPDGDGLELFNEIHLSLAETSTAVMILTGKDETARKVTAFALGAEDYVQKPVDPIELKARIGRRLKHASAPTPEFTQWGPLRFETSSSRAFLRNGSALPETALELTPNEFKILHFFARHAGQTFSRTEMIQKIWGQGAFVAERTIDTHVSNLRKKLNGSECVIESVRHVGYVFKKQGSSPVAA